MRRNSTRLLQSPTCRDRYHPPAYLHCDVLSYLGERPAHSARTLSAQHKPQTLKGEARNEIGMKGVFYEEDRESEVGEMKRLDVGTSTSTSAT